MNTGANSIPEEPRTETFSVVFPPDIEKAVCAVLDRACERNLKLVTAESCTGGLIASLLTDVPGMSHAFERGMVTYTDEAKADQLGVPVALLRKAGAVSMEVARSMAEGALANSRGDISVSVTGYAGSAGVEGEPGLVHFAAARQGSPTLHVEKRYGEVGRGAVRVECVREALGLFLRMME